MITVNPIPVDTASLRACLLAVTRQLELPDSAVAVEGEFPSVGEVRVNLTGGRFHRGLRLAPGTETGGQPAFFVRAISVAATPASFESLPFTLAGQASDAVFALAGSTLSFSRCSAGTLDLSVQHADLEAALTELAREAAAQKGAELKSVKVELKSLGPRALSLRAVAVAKAMFFTATLTITGRVEISESLEVRLTDLACAGDGMIANMAASAVRPRLAAMEGHSVSLRAFVPGLRGVTLAARDGLHVHAEFGA